MIKLLSKSIREYKKYALLTPLMMVLEVLMESFIIFIGKDLVNLMQELNPDMKSVLLYGLLLVVLVIFSLLSLTRSSSSIFCNSKLNSLHSSLPLSVITIFL